MLFGIVVSIDSAFGDIYTSFLSPGILAIIWLL